MKLTAAILLTTAMLCGNAIAQSKPDDHAVHHPPVAATSASDAAALTDGEVRRIDKAAGKLTLRHGEIRNLDMPGMTMVFEVGDPALLAKVKVGDKVKFRAEKRGGGYVVTAIEPAR